MAESRRNVLGTDLKPCCLDPVTGFFRDGLCRFSGLDPGEHTLCAIMTDDFLEYSAEQGNDLITPVPAFGFPGLKAGDRWCVCVSRWVEAMRVGVAPPVDLEATHESALSHVDLDVLHRYAVSAEPEI